MGWVSLLFVLTALETAVGYYIYVVYHYTVFSSVTQGSMARLVLYMLPFNILLLFLADKAASSLSFLHRGGGGQGKNLYSEERSMAMRGEREAACESLAKKIGRKGDAEALRLLLDIATEQPAMLVWISKGAGLRGKIRGLSREDHASFDAMLSRVKRQAPKEEPAFF